jgi:hypothetical protein
MTEIENDKRGRFNERCQSSKRPRAESREQFGPTKLAGLQNAILREIGFGSSLVIAIISVYALTKGCDPMQAGKTTLFRLPSLNLTATDWCSVLPMYSIYDGKFQCHWSNKPGQKRDLFQETIQACGKAILEIYTYTRKQKYHYPHIV